MRTPSAQTLVDMGVRELFQVLEEVPMTMVGRLDVHRRQITFDYVDDDVASLSKPAEEAHGLNRTAFRLVQPDRKYAVGSASASRSFVLAALRALHLTPGPRPHRSQARVTTRPTTEMTTDSHHYGGPQHS
jgi:hypothetical protein